MTQSFSFSFAPIAAQDARILILGSMPGQASLQKQQYYAHPRNSFWPILAEILSMPAHADYPTRCAFLKQQRIAVWDVLQACQRPGSLDQDIEPTSMVANDFLSFLQRQRQIDKILFNGSKAEQLFNRLVIKQQFRNATRGLVYQRLPSTSPAHAAVPVAEKLRLWRAAIQDIKPDD